MADRPGAGSASGDLNLAWADALLAGMASAGVRHAVISPGSRSTLLTLAAHRHHEISVTVIPDERSAAFFAMGLGRQSGRPAVVIGTSGSAPANWLPAAVEAAADAVPLILISADRPPGLHGVGANQTIEQRGLFSSHVRAHFDLPAPATVDKEMDLPRSLGVHAAHRAVWPEPGPVHVNAAFREPLVPSAEALTLPPQSEPPARLRPPLLTPDPDMLDQFAADIAGKNVLIVAGRMRPDPTFAAAVAGLAAQLDCPILADPLSGLRWGPHDRNRVCVGYDLLLRDAHEAQRLAPDAVLQFGGTPTSASLQRFLDQPGRQHWLVAPFGPWADPGRRARQRIYADPARVAIDLGARLAPADDSDWMSRWKKADRRIAGLCDDPALVPAERDLVAALETVLPQASSLFIGNSMAIRAFDTFARGRSSALMAFGNRGASGIDGNVSTALGIAASASGPTTALIGDLTLYHDMNGLLAARDRDITFVVIDNGGGGIFDLLPQRRLPDFGRMWLTPTGLELSRVAALYGLRHRACGSGPELHRHLAEACAASGPDLIEVRIDRAHSTDRFQTLWAAASQR
ncbi:MAG: 2-succinyl-5-enolpyruvyl-6-hydroxy-3-cyclohexene-1-carboxylic-acid synthase [Gammaproteobacteria bacterium]